MMRAFHSTICSGMAGVGRGLQLAARGRRRVRGHEDAPPPAHSQNGRPMLAGKGLEFKAKFPPNFRPFVLDLSASVRLGFYHRIGVPNLERCAWTFSPLRPYPQSRLMNLKPFICPFACKLLLATAFA